MKRMILAILTAIAFAFVLSMPITAQKEEHPNIQAAIHHLEEARTNLQNAAHDFGGHRSAALKHVNEALEECHEALKYDKK